MKRCVIFLLTAVMLLSLSAEVVMINSRELAVNVLSSDQQSTLLEMDLGSFQREAVTIEGEEYWRIGLAGENRTYEAGYPEIPRLTRGLAISNDGLMTVEIVSSEFVEFEMRIVPSRGLLSREIDPAGVPFVLGEQYNRDEFYPAAIINLGVPYIFRDVRGISLNIEPFQYNNVTGVLRVYTSVTVEVTNTGIDEVNVKAAQMDNYQSEFISLYAHQFLNWQEYAASLRYDQIPEDAGRMLIISYGDFMDEMAPFVDWKIQKGIPTTIVDVATIGNNSTNIQNYITSEYEAGDGLVWVMLIGDNSQVATKTYSGAGGDPQYTYLEGNDDYSEIFIGRFSAETAAQVETQVERSIYYERDVIEGDWMQKGIGIASSQGAGQGHYGEADYVHMGYIRDDLLDYGYLEVDEIYDTNGGNATMVSNALNEGRGIINYCGHGSNTTWVSTGFSNTHVDALTNDYMLPFISSIACVNGNFTGITCFAEAWMRATNGDAPTGAVAIFASSINQSWAPPMYAQDESIDLMCAEELNTLGGLWFNGVSYMIDESNDTAMANTWHIFGDPSLQVRSMTPEAMTIDHLPTAFIGLPTFAVTTDAPGAMYCLSYEGEIIDNGYADESGDFEIDMSNAPVMPADLTLTISAYNKITSVETLQLLPNDGPYLFLQTVILNSGGDDVIEAGEEVLISLCIENLGSDPSLNTIFTMEIDDEYITVTDGEEALGEIQSDETLDLQEIFSFNVSEEINFGHPFEMIITMSCDEDEWVTIHALASYAPPGLWINPGSFSYELVRGENGTQSMEISNYRDDPVIYSIRTEAVPGRSIEGTEITCDTHHFEPGQVVNWTFSLTNASTDDEWIEGVMINFPDGVEITAAADFWGGSGGPLEWDGVMGDGVEINWFGETPSGYGRLRDGETATCELEVAINQGFTGSLVMDWRINGDGYGLEPHDLFGDIVLDYPLSWIVLSEFEGELSYGEAAVIDVTVNTDDLEIGLHECEIVITDNRMETRIPVYVEVLEPISGDETEVSQATILKGNFPNPFNPETEIRFVKTTPGDVTLTIYNLKGQVVKEIQRENLGSGEHSILWQGDDSEGRTVSSGVYFYKFKDGDFTTSKKMVLMK
ncbi:MAG: T9SS type A sorting domain-containing protein [Candidatus Cloacimonetes bacterium]|nr:T9SS type A sorting domain-containing protein [Candidatus Cloacimonadota bacterium]